MGLLSLLVIGAPADAQVHYSSKQTSGPFLASAAAASIDWVVLNNTSFTASIRVTVYQLPVGSPKVEAPVAPVVLSLAPGETTHNAGTAGFAGTGAVFEFGNYYEIFVESNRPVLPAVTQWSESGGGSVIAGTLIPSGSFTK